MMKDLTAGLLETVLNDIRETTNKVWVLGSEKFKRRISKRLDWPTASAGHGGDRTSDVYRKSINLTP